MTSSPKILLVDDDPFTLTMLASTLHTLGFTEITSLRTVTQAIVAATKASPNVAILDLDLGEGPTGIDLAHRLRKLNPIIGVIILSTYTEPRLIGTNQRPLPENSIYIVKQSISDTKVLLDAITNSVKSNFDPINAVSLPPSTPISRIKDTQIEIMRLVATGISNAQIAEMLVMKEASVEKAIARLIKQLDIKATNRQNQRVLIAQEYYRLTRGTNDSH